ncbi:hypothetical protein [Paenibacillus tundrae]|uniref:hypothetical protein n=1 Tax=Paenibacillus tundrae TaxID=528187 RepID=UPI0030CEDBF5
MSKDLYSLRCQDLHNAVHTNVDSTSGYLTDYTATRLTGMAGQVISTIHGMDVVDYQKFQPIAAHQYGIDAMWLTNVFEVLQECDLVQVNGSRLKPESIHVKSKYFKSNYDILSAHLVEDMKPQEIEIGTVDILQRLSVSPLTLDDVKQHYNLSDDEAAKLKLFGTESQLFQFTEIEEGNHIISTPMYWDENATIAHDIIKQTSPQMFTDAMTAVKKYQGFPVSTNKDPVMQALVAKGILPTPTILMDGTQHPFLFTPYNTSPEEKIILEKARDILACVRCGQHFAKYPINNPFYILNALINSVNDFSLRSTTVAREQYFLLASKGIGTLTHTGNNWYSFKLIDTPENIKAVKLAIQLLDHGEQVENVSNGKHQIQQFLGTRGTSLSNFKSIKESNKKKDISPEVAKELMSCIQGAYTYKGGKR